MNDEYVFTAIDDADISEWFIADVLDGAMMDAIDEWQDSE